jgi:BlaI family transcriptional regulator, penicillinase repressor
MTRQPNEPLGLSRRERQIMDILFRLGQASASEIWKQMPDAPTYTTTRGLLRVLERKGHVAHEKDGVRYLYRPIARKADAGSSVLAHVVRTFFDGSPARAMAALLGNTRELDAEEIERLTTIVRGARKKRR